MPAFNSVCLVGNLTRDIELRRTANNTAVAEVGLAINEKVKKGEEWVNETVFVDCTLWGRTAENASEYLRKGSPVLISGRLKLDQWEDKATGGKRSKLVVTADKVQFLSADRHEGDGRQQDDQSHDAEPQRQGRKEGHNAYGGNDGGGSSYTPF